MKGPLPEIDAEPCFAKQRKSQCVSETPAPSAQPGASRSWRPGALFHVPLPELPLLLMTPDGVFTHPAETSCFCDPFRPLESGLVISLGSAWPSMRSLAVTVPLSESGQRAKNPFCSQPSDSPRQL